MEDGDVIAEEEGGAVEDIHNHVLELQNSAIH